MEVHCIKCNNVATAYKSYGNNRSFVLWMTPRLVTDVYCVYCYKLSAICYISSVFFPFLAVRCLCAQFSTKLCILQDKKVEAALTVELKEDLNDYNTRNDTRERFEKIHKEVRLPF